MKKVLGLFLLMAISTSIGQCAISVKDMTDTTYMKNQGYSKETIRLAKDQSFKPKTDKFKNKNIAGRDWQKFNSYIDPAYDDGDFGYHDIQFKNRWDEF